MQEKTSIFPENGSADIYHIDGDDKLKQRGFAIHGCVDWFSRTMLCLKVCVGDSNSIIVANNCLKCIETRKSCPRILRIDMR